MLRNSQLLQAFLSVDVDGNPFTSSIFPSLNIGKVFRKVPSKLVKEKGQHLNAFLQSFAHSIEQDTSQASCSDHLTRSCSSASLGSLGGVPNSIHPQSKPETSAGQSIRARMFGNLADLTCSALPTTPLRFRSRTLISRTLSNAAQAIEPRSLMDVLSFCISHVFFIPRWLRQIFHAFDLLARHTLEAGLMWLLKKKLGQIFEERRFEDIIHDVRDILFFDTDPPRTIEEKRQRKEKLFHDMIHFFATMVLFYSWEGKGLYGL